MPTKMIDGSGMDFATIATPDIELPLFRPQRTRTPFGAVFVFGQIFCERGAKLQRRKTCTSKRGEQWARKEMERDET